MVFRPGVGGAGFPTEHVGVGRGGLESIHGGSMGGGGLKNLV